MTDTELTKMLRSSANRVVNYAADRIEALTAERDRLRESLLCGRRLWEIARDDRIRLLIQLEQCEASHE